METVISADGTTIAYDTFGAGPPLILVNGALSQRSAAVSLASTLGHHFQVFTYDRRGRGNSGDTAPYAVDSEIEDLAAVSATAGGTPNVFGHSSGAILVLEAAAGGVPMSKLAVYEPPYLVDETRERPADIRERVTQLIDAGQRGEAVKLFLATGPQVPADVIAAMATSPMWASMEAMAHTLLYDLAIAADLVMPGDRIAAIQVPALALCGGDSPEWARNAVAAVAEALPNGRFTSLAGQTHGAADDVLAPVLVDFF